MPTQVIESFRFGLDTRRDMLTSTPGTLLKLENAHINPGAMAEKRKGFFLSANAFPSSVFGLEMTAAGLITFGSVAPGTPGQTTPLPAGVTYQQLVPPLAVSPPHMTALVYSCNFNGKAFAIATFSDGNTYCYYNGVIVLSSLDGKVANIDISVQAAGLATQINTILGWLADQNVYATAVSDSQGYHEAAQNGSVLAMSPAGVHFTPTVRFTSASGGILGARLAVPNDQNYGGVAAVGASVAFTLTGGNTGTIDVAVGAVDLIGGTPLPFDTSLTQTALDVTNAINQNTFATGYSASVNVTTISVFAPTSLGLFVGNLTVTTTGGGSPITTANAAVGGGFSMTLTPSGLDVLIKTSGTNATVHGTIAVSTSGAQGAVSFLWTEVNPDGTPVTAPGSGISMSPITPGSPPTVTAATVTFSKFLFANSPVTGYFKCNAHDAGGGGLDVFTLFTVRLEADNNT